MLTVAEARVSLSSVTVTPASITTGVEGTLLPSVNSVVPRTVVTTGLLAILGPQIYLI